MNDTPQGDGNKGVDAMKNNLEIRMNDTPQGDGNKMVNRRHLYKLDKYKNE